MEQELDSGIEQNSVTMHKAFKIRGDIWRNYSTIWYVRGMFARQNNYYEKRVQEL